MLKGGKKWVLFKEENFNDDGWGIMGNHFNPLLIKNGAKFLRKTLKKCFFFLSQVKKKGESFSLNVVWQKL